MDMCYEGALVMPSSYAVMDEEEMTYVEGGISTAAKAGIIAAIVVVGAAVTVALVYGQFWLGAKIMGLSIKGFAQACGAKAVATVIAGTLGLSVAACTKAVQATLSL